MGLRDKLRRVKDSLRRGPNKNKPLQMPGVVKQLVGSTIPSAYTSTSALTSAPEPLRNAANITASGKLPINPVTIVQNENLGAIQPNELNDLWLQAFDTLKSQEPDLMKEYSRILLDEANVEPVGSITQNAPISNDALVQLTKEKLENFTIPSSRSGDKIEKVVKVVMAANNFIASTLQSEPHAAIAWAGVSIFLPLLINSVTEKAGCREGLDKIPPLIDRYALLESSLWNPTSSEKQRSSTVKLQLRNTMAKLYASILLYEARVIVQFCGQSMTRYFRDALKLNDWTCMFKEITELDQQCRDMIDAIDRDLNRRVTQEQQTLLTNALNKFSEAQALQRAKDHQDCLQSFRTGNLYELQKSRNPNRIPGTCKWVLEHPTFIDWKQGNGPGILWISADPGYGKTVLSKALVDECIVATDQNTTICYFFFKDISKEQRSLTKALAALLHQIFSSQNHLLAYTESSWAKNNAEIANLADEMWDIITKISMDPKSGNIICILDALDECEAAGRSYFLKQLQTLYKTTASSKSKVSKVKFLITSRPYYEIEEDFKSLTDTFPGIRLAGEDTTAIIKQEINLVIDAEVDKLKLPSKADTRLRTRLKDIEHRTYLWLYLILDTIRFRAQASKQLKTFEKILDEPLPATIDEAYEAILSKSPDKEEAIKLLHIVVGAERPLTLEELNIALNINECYDGSQSFEDIELEDSEMFPKRIRYLCGLFVSVSDSRVYLIHQTAKEFLISKDSNRRPIGWKHSLEPYISQSVLGKICVSYLYLSMFSKMDTWNCCFITSPIGRPYILDEGRFKFLKYAADYWMTHYEKSPGNIDLQTIVDICSPTIRRSIWFQACLGGRYPPKHFQNIAYTIWNSLKSNDFEETRAMSTLMIASCLGSLDIAKILSTTLSHSEICQYWNNRTAVSLAIINGDYKMTELLISAGANIDDNDSNGEVQSALQVAVEHKQNDIMYLLLDNKAGTHAALITAAQEYFVHWQPGYFGLILARNGALVPGLRARLMETAISMHDPINVVRAIEFVQKCPHEPSMSETMGKSLFLVLSHNPPNIDACSLIINDSAINDIDNCWRVNLSNGCGSSVVYFVASRGEVRLLKLLRARGASLDMDSNGSAFYQAVKSGNVECVKFFIQEDPGISTLYINGNIDYSPILNAFEKGNHNMVRYLIEHGADASRGIGHRFGFYGELYYFTILTAVEMGKMPESSGIVKRDTRQTLVDLSIQQIEELIGYGFDINCEVRGITFLSHAASSGNLDRVKWLIEHGANVDGHFSGGQSILSSPLMEAIWGCNAPSSVIKILLDNGASVDGPKDYKLCNGPTVASSVHLAIIKDDVEALQILLEHNADFNLQGDNYGIPLKEAAANGQVNLMRLLVSHGADVNAIGQGIPVLHEAIFNRQLEAVAVLLDLGAYINIIDYVRGTPLQLAKAMHYPKMVSLLQRRGAKEVYNLKSAGTSYFYHQARRHISTASLVLSRKEIETPNSEVFSRRRSVALQTWATYDFDYHGTESVSIFK